MELIGASADRLCGEAVPGAIGVFLNFAAEAALGKITEEAVLPQGLHKAQIEGFGVEGCQSDTFHKHQTLTNYNN